MQGVVWSRRERIHPFRGVRFRAAEGVGPYEGAVPGRSAGERGSPGCVIIVVGPFGRVIIDVLPPDTVVVFIPQDVIIISPLPDICANGPIDQPLHCANSPWNCCIRRGRRPRRPVDRSHKQDLVHVIWHDHIFIHGQTGDVVGRPV